MLLTNAAGILGVMLGAQVAPLSVSELLGNADPFHGQPVTVTGTMSNFRANALRRGGPMYTFDLSDGTGTVHVTAFAKPDCESGAATVEGTFVAVKWRMRARGSFEGNTAPQVVCLPPTLDPPRREGGGASTPISLCSS